jgi:hypothetical protein
MGFDNVHACLCKTKVCVIRYVSLGTFSRLFERCGRSPCSLLDIKCGKYNTWTYDREVLVGYWLQLRGHGSKPMGRDPQVGRGNIPMMKDTRKRKYREDFIKFGFTSLVINGDERPQCVRDMM